MVRAIRNVVGCGVVVWAVLARASGAEDAVWPVGVRIVQWNVENLFDAEDDPDNPGDDAFTPRGWERWTERLYQQKLERLAEVLGPLDADVLCVEEIENRRVLNDLRAVLSNQYGHDYPYVVHREGTDHRGIDVTMLSRLEPARARWITPVEEQRDILIVDFAGGGQPLTVLVNHWKSQLGKRAESDATRAQQARAARAEVDGVLSASPQAAVVMVGDFNENFDGPALVKEFGSAVDREKVLADPQGRLLYNLHADLAPNERGTLYYHQGRHWNSFDSMNVSRSLLTGPEAGEGGWRVRPASYAVIRQPFMLNAEGQPKPFRRDRTKGAAPWSYITGYADHLPVVVSLERVTPTPAVATAAGR